MTGAQLGPCRRLVISPHLDDAVLSIGGALAAWAAAGERPVVVTACAGPPRGPLTDFARFQHERWAHHAGWPPGADVVARRRAEDEHALTGLGAAALWLDYPDCIYRGERYTTEAGLFGPLAEDEAGLVEALADELAALWRATAGAVVYLPLGLGNHVDHQLVALAGACLAAHGAPLVRYEDFPYAVREGGAEGRARLTTGGRPTMIDITEWLERKVEAVAAYASQVPVLFGSAAAMPAAVRDYALAAGAGRPAERLWSARPIDRG